MLRLPSLLALARGYCTTNGGKSQEKVKKYFPEQIRSRTAQNREKSAALRGVLCRKQGDSELKRAVL